MDEFRETIPFRSALIPIVDALDSLCESIKKNSWIISWNKLHPDFMPGDYLPIITNPSPRFDESEAMIGALAALEKARNVNHTIESLPEGSPKIGLVSTIFSLCERIICDCESFLGRDGFPLAHAEGDTLIYLDRSDPCDPIVYNYYQDRFNVFFDDFEQLLSVLDRVKKISLVSDRRVLSPQDPVVEGRANMHFAALPAAYWEHWPHREIGMQIWEELRIATIEGRLLKKATCLADRPKEEAHNWKRLIPPQLRDLIESQRGKGSKLKAVESVPEITPPDAESGRRVREKCGVNPSEYRENGNLF